MVLRLKTGHEKQEISIYRGFLEENQVRIQARDNECNFRWSPFVSLTHCPDCEASFTAYALKKFFARKHYSTAL
jgi:hypothetical protein